MPEVPIYDFWWRHLENRPQLHDFLIGITHITLLNNKLHGVNEKTWGSYYSLAARARFDSCMHSTSVACLSIRAQWEAWIFGEPAEKGHD